MNCTYNDKILSLVFLVKHFYVEKLTFSTESPYYIFTIIINQQNILELQFQQKSSKIVMFTNNMQNIDPKFYPNHELPSFNFIGFSTNASESKYLMWQILSEAIKIETLWKQALKQPLKCCNLFLSKFMDRKICRYKVTPD